MPVIMSPPLCSYVLSVLHARCLFSSSSNIVEGGDQRPGREGGREMRTFPPVA